MIPDEAGRATLAAPPFAAAVAAFCGNGLAAAARIARAPRPQKTPCERTRVWWTFSGSRYRVGVLCLCVSKRGVEKRNSQVKKVFALCV
jgi:hypothetical protein